MLVPDISDPESKNDEAFVQRHDRFLNLPRNIKEKLASVKVSQRIQAIGQKYGFELLHLANITRLIREYYFGEVRLEEFPKEIEQRMGVSLLTAQEITRYIQSEIIDWDPWAEYLAKLPKFPVRDIVQQYPKIGDTQITAGYIELKNSEDLEEPTIKNWLKDYVSHLGYDSHSQMQRAEYLFHSENGKNLNQQDREKVGIVLKSFDEKIPLPVDEENEEIVFDGMMSEPQPKADQPMAGASKFVINTQTSKPQPAPGRQESFIKPYAPASQPPRQTPEMPTRSREINYTEPVPRPPKTTPQPLSFQSAPLGETVHPNLISQPNLQARLSTSHTSPFQNAPSTEANREIPSIKIHSITEHNEPRIQPQQNVQRPAPPQPAPRPKYKIIDPFFSKPMSEPRIDGNIVDLSREE